MHTKVYTMELTIRATPDQFRFLRRMVRAQRGQISDRFEFTQVRYAFGAALLRGLKSYGICQWNGWKEGKIEINEARLDVCEIHIDRDLAPKPGVEPIKLQTYRVEGDDAHPPLEVIEHERVYVYSFVERITDQLIPSGTSCMRRPQSMASHG